MQKKPQGFGRRGPLGGDKRPQTANKKEDDKWEERKETTRKSREEITWKRGEEDHRTGVAAKGPNKWVLIPWMYES